MKKVVCLFVLHKIKSKHISQLEQDSLCNDYVLWLSDKEDSKQQGKYFWGEMISVLPVSSGNFGISNMQGLCLLNCKSLKQYEHFSYKAHIIYTFNMCMVVVALLLYYMYKIC